MFGVCGNTSITASRCWSRCGADPFNIKQCLNIFSFYELLTAPDFKHILSRDQWKTFECLIQCIVIYTVDVLNPRLFGPGRLTGI